jgi:ribosome-associated protein
MSDSIDVARRAVEIAEEQQGSDVLLLDITGLTTFSDYFVIVSAETTRQINALTDAITGGLKAVGGRLHHQEGVASSGWVLLDYSDVIVHVFSSEERDRYRLEQAWSEAVTLVRVQ